LYEVGAPNAPWLMVLFTAYHLLVIPLAIGLYVGLPARSKWPVAPWLLGLAGLIGVPLGAYARCDPGCFDATTFRGQLHGVLVVVTVPLIFAAMFAVWYQLRSAGYWLWYRRYTFTTMMLSIALGMAMIPFMRGAYAGLLERVSVVLIIQWYAVTGIRLMFESRRP
jgi:hypothetical protein